MEFTGLCGMALELGFEALLVQVWTAEYWRRSSGGAFQHGGEQSAKCLAALVQTMLVANDMSHRTPGAVALEFDEPSHVSLW